MKLHFITVCPTDNYFVWQVHLWLESLRELGMSSQATVLLFNPIGRPKNNKWEQLASLYPESEFKTYYDDGSVAPFISTYIPILRMYTMKKYCEEYPEIENEAVVFYCDSDILFLDNFNVSHLLDDDVNYLSDTNSYISASYFDSKLKDVIPEKLEQYKKIDVLNQAASIVGINREICEKYNNHSGGTQYLLKKTNAEFWDSCLKKCIPLLTYLRNINKEYFENESKGIQSWTADMWIVLWEIWNKKGETKVVKELDFTWATDPISKLPHTTILHNAGVTNTFINNIPYFYKGKYHQGQNPLEDNHIEVVLNNETSKTKCTWYYTNKLKQLKEKYNFKY